ncbi:MAG: rod shape-determining protein [Clostridia bacterium]
MIREGLAIDLGTINTLIARRNHGIVLKEASAVAVNSFAHEEILAVGNEAIEMRGRTPNGISVKYPLKDGVIADYILAETMIRQFIRRIIGNGFGFFNTRAVFCVPNCITPVERAAIEESAHRAGIRDVLVMEEAMAAALGAALPVNEPIGSMIVDIGGGTTDIAVVTLNGIATGKSIRTGGLHIDEAISSYIKQEYGIAIGARTAEQIKITIGNLIINADDEIKIRGLSLLTGLPQSASLTTCEVKSAISRPVDVILNAISDVLFETPPELAGDIIKSGITLTGGGALLKGLPEVISARTKIEARLAQRPLESVVMGAYYVLDGINDRSIEFDRDSGMILRHVERLA